MTPDYYSQHTYRCRLEWGRDGARRAAARGDILIIVDTLSFTTVVATAVEHSAYIYPCAHNEHPAELARMAGGEIAVHRRDVPAKGRFSLSPPTFIDIAPETSVVVASPNGATCSRYGSDVPYLFAGALVNARAVGEAAAAILEQTDLCVTVVACGERWIEPGDDGALRVAVEDHLAAGAIIAQIRHSKSPEAWLCQQAFIASESNIKNILLECGSGRELCERGYEGDVLHAARLNIYESVPIMRNKRFERQ